MKTCVLFALGVLINLNKNNGANNGGFTCDSAVLCGDFENQNDKPRNFEKLWDFEKKCIDFVTIRTAIKRYLSKVSLSFAYPTNLSLPSYNFSYSLPPPHYDVLNKEKPVPEK